MAFRVEPRPTFSREGAKAVPCSMSAGFTARHDFARIFDACPATTSRRSPSSEREFAADLQFRRARQSLAARRFLAQRPAGDADGSQPEDAALHPSPRAGGLRLGIQQLFVDRRRLVGLLNARPGPPKL